MWLAVMKFLALQSLVLGAKIRHQVPAYLQVKLKAESFVSSDTKIGELGGAKLFDASGNCDARAWRACRSMNLLFGSWRATRGRSIFQPQGAASSSSGDPMIPSVSAASSSSGDPMIPSVSAASSSSGALPVDIHLLRSLLKIQFQRVPEKRQQDCHRLHSPRLVQKSLDCWTSAWRWPRISGRLIGRPGQLAGMPFTGLRQPTWLPQGTVEVFNPTHLHQFWKLVLPGFLCVVEGSGGVRRKAFPEGMEKKKMKAAQKARWMSPSAMLAAQNKGEAGLPGPRSSLGRGEGESRQCAPAERRRGRGAQGRMAPLRQPYVPGKKIGKSCLLFLKQVTGSLIACLSGKPGCLAKKI
eukprot:s1692_g2.t3